ncbi:sensor histidine kinase [Specibacter sp. RAF43]|uniref:sensor histidine kinase n=1 Tax=Specibacter sp. RAF43 TaxID=3233057 RepID=UPI003F9CDA49
MSLTVALMAVLAAAFYPERFADPMFVTSLGMHAAIFLLCVSVPWGSLPQPSFLILPYLDFVAVGFSRYGSGQYVSSVGLLALFPVFWLAASGLARKTAIVGSAGATVLIAWIPLFFGPESVTPAQLAQPLIFPFMLTAFAITVVFLTSSMDSHRRAVQTMDAQLRAALQTSRDRERLLATVVDTVSVGLVVVGRQGATELMNSTQQALHSLACPGTMENPQEKDLLIFHPDKVTPLEAELRPVCRAARGEVFTNYQIWVGAGDQARAVSTTARSIQGEDGRSGGAVVAFHDVTDMVGALAAKDDFMSNISHEFRTPLTSIQGYLALALDASEDLPGEVERFLLVAERNAERLGSLVSELLTTDSMTIATAPTDVAGLIADCLASSRPAAAKNGVALINEATAPLRAMLDAGRIGQALDNLISNAIKYSPDGGTVTVRAWTMGPDVICEVHDTGMGMNGAEQAEAFTKFFRAEPARERSIPGLGLGLLITKMIVVKHGGTISIHSERNVGTVMRMVLPRGASVPA